MLEKKHQDQIRLIESASAKERELLTAHANRLRADAEMQMANAQEQIARLRKRVIVLEEVSRKLFWGFSSFIIVQ